MRAAADIAVHAISAVEVDSFIANIGSADVFGANLTGSFYSLRAKFSDQFVIPLSSKIPALADINHDLLAKLDLLGGSLHGMVDGIAQSCSRRRATASPASSAGTRPTSRRSHRSVRMSLPTPPPER